VLLRELRALCVLLVLAPAAAAAQTGTIEGRVRATDGAAVAAASVTVTAVADSTPVRAAETDRLGIFRVTGLAPGDYVVRAGSLGYGEAARTVRVAAGATTSVEFELERRAVDLPGVAVEVERRRETFERAAGLTSSGLARDELKRIPGVAESDVLRAIEVLPGVVSTSDFSSAFNVRGGSADQNLILLDGFPIYNPFHLGGLFSVFNADMVARAELLAGGFPAEYGGRVASVLEVESDATGIGTDVRAGVSVLATRAALGLELPSSASRTIGLRSARGRVSVRRSYFDVLMRPVFEFPYHLTDVQLYAEGWSGGGARVSVTGYTGRDNLDLAGVDSFPLRVRWNWGNDVAGVRYTRPFAGGRVLDARAGVSRFRTGIRFPDFGDTDFRSEITHVLTRLDGEIPAGASELRAGLALDRLAYDNLAVTGGSVFRQGLESGVLFGGYAQAAFQPGPWRIETGVRFDAWSAGVAPAIAALSPRLAVKRFLGRDVAVKAAVGRFTQFVHSLRDEELPLGIDVWVLAGERAPHVVSDQAQLGVEAFLRGGWFGALEGYWRTFDGVVTNNFADDPNDQLDDLIAGEGLSYGVDLQLRRDVGRVRPSLAVSWLRATREFADPTRGIDPAPVVAYPPIFDRRIDVDLLVQVLLPGDVEGGLRWNYGGGLPYTRPLGGYEVFTYRLVDDGARSPPETEPALGIVLGDRNAQRYPPYHRLDAGVRRTFRPRWGRITPYLDVLNVYNRRNPLFYFYEFDENPPTRSGISMFPLLPTAGVEIAF
jgi:hypothetical protein